MNNSYTSAEQATNKLHKYIREWHAAKAKQAKSIHETDDARIILQTLEELCRQGADLNYLERERGFVLIPHVFWCQKLIQFFIDRGMNVNAQDEDGNTALHHAILNAIPGFVKYRCNCSYEYRRPINFVKFLLDRSADPNIANLYGDNATLLIPNEALYTTSYEYPSTLAELLVQGRGANVEASNGRGQSVLHIHSNNTNDTFIKVYKGDTDTRNSAWLYSQTPLMVAARRDCLKNCQMLVEKGANINATDLQGYTALHIASLRGANECAEFLVKMGADPRAKSVSGKNAYDLGVIHYKPFTCGATPAEQLEIYEIAGAIRILTRKTGFTNLDGQRQADKLWDMAMDVCKKFDLQPSKEFLENYEHLRQNLILPNEEIYLTAVDTISRLSSSETERSRFWKLLKYNNNKWNNYYDYIFPSLNSLEEECKLDFRDFASIDIDDFESLLSLAQFFQFWLKYQANMKDFSRRISHLHSLAKLSISCFKKWMDETDSNIVSGIPSNLYVRLCYVLTFLHYRFRGFISEKESKDTEQLLKTLVEMDIRNGMTYNNSLMHDILINQNELEYIFASYVVGALVDFEFVDVKARNQMGMEPVQWINKRGLPTKVLVKLADRGAHIDALNVWGGETGEVFEKEMRRDLLFRYDSLQCACARVVAKSLVPYVNRVPQKIVNFIRMHDWL